MTPRVTPAEARRLLGRLLDQESPAPMAPRPRRKPQDARKARPGPTGRCVECGAIVGKGRKASTCVPCDLVAALRRHGADLPMPAREARFHDARKWRFDLSWAAALLAVECDGGTWMANGGRHNTDADREKLNEAAALGWRIIRLTPQQIARDPAGCVALVRRALEIRP